MQPILQYTWVCNASRRGRLEATLHLNTVQKLFFCTEVRQLPCRHFAQAQSRLPSIVKTTVLYFTEFNPGAPSTKTSILELEETRTSIYAPCPPLTNSSKPNISHRVNSSTLHSFSSFCPPVSQSTYLTSK
ncbi:hypothetical protein M501DRAFT_993801 [Patellaria atrata CBS 101060]|uniref:Uncharacterized protein n=1 Tax=Patellaria atrata CBS 101060 TaxID=1346257 RepID=A0A9P4SI74_9PEZI|nr:hypothetical protein M501DRAFT_993801 [Patellaria atrata CBS 101060]